MTTVAPKRQRRSKRSTCKEELGRLRKKVPRRHHNHVNRGNRPLRPAGLREQKDKRQRHQPITPLSTTGEIGSVERAPGRRATAMVEDGIVKFFAVLSRVGGSDSLDHGCIKCSRLHWDQLLCNFLCNFNALCNPKYGCKRPDTERARAVSTPF